MNVEQALRSRVVALCKEKNTSISVVCGRANIDQNIIADLSSGTNCKTSIETVERLCFGLGVSMFEFFNNDVFLNLEKVG